MISRRGFFGMLTGLAASPLFGQFFRAEVSYRYRFTTTNPPEKWQVKKASGYTPAKTCNNAFHPTLVHPAVDPVEAKKMWEYYNQIFVCPITLGTLYWPKNSRPE